MHEMPGQAHMKKWKCKGMNRFFAAITPELIVYAAILIVTLIGFIKCILPVARTTRGLNVAVKKLEESTGTETTALWHDEAFVGKRLEATWQKFLMTEEEMEKRGLTCPVEDYINTRTVTKIPGNASLSELIPSLLTSLGILGTFIGLTRGLTGLDMTDANTLMNGIPILLDGMKAAFGTSVLGISCSLIFSMLNRALQGNSYRAIDSFIEVFTKKTGHKALDPDYQMVVQSNDRNKMLGSVTTGLEETVTGTVRGIMTETLNPLTEALEKHIQSAKAVETITEDTARLQKMTEEICNNYQSFLEQLKGSQIKNEEVTEGMMQTLNVLVNNVDAQNSMMQTLNDSQQDLIRAIRENQKSTSQNMERMVSAQITATNDLAEAGETIRDAGDKLAASYDKFVSVTAMNLNGSLKTFTDSLMAMNAVINQKTAEIEVERINTADQLKEIKHLLTRLVQQTGSSSEQNKNSPATKAGRKEDRKETA